MLCRPRVRLERPAGALYSIIAVGLALASQACQSDPRRAFSAQCGTNEDCASGLCFQSLCTSSCVSSDQCGKLAVCVEKVCRPRPPRKDLFSDDFADATMRNWAPYGTPPPKWVALFADHTGVFDNNGDGNYLSGAVSKVPVECPSACTVEADVYAGLTNLAGCWSDVSIGLSSTPYPNGQGRKEDGFNAEGLGFMLTGIGDKCFMWPAAERRHTWAYAWLLAEDGTVAASGMINADAFANRWTRLTIAIAADRQVRFFADDQLVWLAGKRLHPDIVSGRNIVLGQRSSGSAGKSYHDSIAVWQ